MTADRERDMSKFPDADVIEIDEHGKVHIHNPRMTDADAVYLVRWVLENCAMTHTFDPAALVEQWRKERQ